MIVLILGLTLWVAAHAFKRILPQRRIAMGDRAKGLVAAGVLGSVVLMVFGYRAAPYIDLWYPPSFMVHLNNLLMVFALYLTSPAPKRGKLVAGMRHPMQTGFALWAIAHLLVNGDLASVILFGTLLAWSAVTAQVINRAEPDWQPRSGGSHAIDGVCFVASIVLLGVVGYVHGLLGPWPFPG